MAEFVEGNSRVTLVRAETIMSPLEGREPTPKTVSVGSELGEIMDEFMVDQTPVTVVDGEGQAVGHITITDALRALRG